MGHRGIRAALLALLPLGGALHALAAASPERVEALYARGLYPRLVGAMAPVSGALPFSLAEWLTAALCLAVALTAIRRWRRGRRTGLGAWRLVGAGLVWALGLAGLLYCGFLLLWGLNHQRPPAAVLAGLDVHPAPPAELAALSEDLVERADLLRRGRSEDSAGVMRLAEGRERALARVGEGFTALGEGSLLPLPPGPAPAPKRPLLSPLLWRMGITGIYVPFTAEPNVNDTVPEPELPFVAAHEMAHLRGFAREDEASWVGHLACAAHPDPDYRYSGALAMSLHALAALARADRPAYDRIAALRSPAVLRDVGALREWSLRAQGPVRRAARRVNDTYLKSQGTPDGVRSYGRVVDLLLAERRARGAESASP